MPGTHAQKVRWTLAEEQLAPASTLAEGLAVALALALAVELVLVDGVEDGLLLLQAASSVAPAMTGSAYRIRVLISTSTVVVVFTGALAPLRGR
jgi:hypothetical protein